MAALRVNPGVRLILRANSLSKSADDIDERGINCKMGEQLAYSLVADD